jgi:hypothetical protein
VRYLDIHEDDQIDEAPFADWVKQAAPAGDQKPAGRPWLRLDNEALWTTIGGRALSFGIHRAIIRGQSVHAGREHVSRGRYQVENAEGLGPVWNAGSVLIWLNQREPS